MINTYLQYGFTYNDKDRVEKPLCLICNEILSTESMKPSKLKSHINAKHAKYSGKPIEYFERLLKSAKQKKLTKIFFTMNQISMPLIKPVI